MSEDDYNYLKSRIEYLRNCCFHLDHEIDRRGVCRKANVEKSILAAETNISEIKEKIGLHYFVNKQP